MIFYRSNKCFIEQRVKVKDFIRRGVLWALQVLTELLVDTTKSKAYFMGIFNLIDDVFQVETSQNRQSKRSFTADLLYLLINENFTISHAHTSLYVVYCKTLTLNNFLTLYFLTLITEIHIVLILNLYLTYHCGLIILSHQLNIQLDRGLKKVDVDSLVCITRWIIKRGIHKINMDFAMKDVIIGKHVKVDNISKTL